MQNPVFVYLPLIAKENKPPPRSHRSNLSPQVPRTRFARVGLGSTNIHTYQSARSLSAIAANCLPLISFVLARAAADCIGGRMQETAMQMQMQRQCDAIIAK
jgi:hypothetical protein